MNWKNTASGYGIMAIGLHWLMALLVLVLYPLGLWMVALDYYHPWYQRAPDLHRTLGVVAALLLVLRLGWRLVNPRPLVEGRPWEQRLALLVHRAFYVLLVLLPVTGYLITTADGHPLPLLGGLELPALGEGFENQEDVAGEVHEWLAHTLIALVALHSAAALKHHFVNRDSTLRRMLRPANNREE